MEQVGVFIVRHFGGIHLGKRHFEIVQNLATHALQMMFQKKLKQKAHPRMDSQSSIASFMSIVSTATHDGSGEDGNESDILTQAQE